jgi:hypothetical protein
MLIRFSAAQDHGETSITWSQLLSTYGVLVAGALWCERPRRSVPIFWYRARPMTSEMSWSRWEVYTRVALLGMAVVSTVLLSTLELRAITAMWAGLIAALGVSSILHERAALGYLGRLRAAPPLGDAPSWARVEGIVRATTPDENALDPIVLGVSSEIRSEVVGRHGARGDQVTNRELLGDPSFAVQTQGGNVFVDSTEIVWASMASEASNEVWRQYTVVDSIPAGGRVAAVGKWVNREGNYWLCSDGARPAIVFATSHAGRPMAYARALARHRVLTAVGAVALVAAELTLGGWFG